MSFEHISVLLGECISGLNIKSDGLYVDGTLGGAGHSFEICERIKNGKLIGIDQDIDAINAAKKKLEKFDFVTYVHKNFFDFQHIAEEFDIVGKVDGILLDLGVSSYQLDKAERGFSYMHNAPLDMRMDREKNFSAFDVVNEYDKKSLAEVIYKYGEEKWAERIAEFIVNERKDKPIETTFELVSVIKRAVPKGARNGGPHPAKRTFQAIRIEVNSELEILKKSLFDMTSALKSGGRICVITFHSLEDRIVKNTFREMANPCTCPRDFPVCVCGKKPIVRIITKKPVVPSEKELLENHRARSAKLRIAEKL